MPPNVELLPPTQVQYAESFAVIPEPFTSRSSQDQQVGIHGMIILVDRVMMDQFVKSFRTLECYWY